MEKGKPLPLLPHQRRSYATTHTNASTPSKFYVSEGSIDPTTRAEAVTEVVSPDSETTPQLMSKNTVSYHPNYLEMLGSEMMTGVHDPQEAIVGSGSAVLNELSPTQSLSQAHTKDTVEIEHYDIVGGWTQDAFGRMVYIERGTIEEVDEEAEEERIKEERMLLPRPSSLELLDEGDRLNFGWDLTEPLPTDATPPPRPKQTVWKEIMYSPVTAQSAFRMPTVPAAVGGSWYTPAEPLGVDADADANADSTGSSPVALPPEVLDLEMQTIAGILALVNSGLEDVKTLREQFIKLCTMFFLPEHIDATYHVEKALSAAKDAVNRRKKIPQPHWDGRSAEWQMRYETRLISLRKSVQRLCAIQRFVDSHSDRPKQSHLKMILDKLRAHERKYIDIANKLHASFDRLKLRHLHVMLVDAYAAEVAAQKNREDHRESFYRKRAEAKVKRESLRKEFYAMRSVRGHSAI